MIKELKRRTVIDSVLLVVMSIYLVLPVAAENGTELGAKSKNEVKQRKFEFTYSVSVNGLPEGAKVRIWIPVAQTNRDQSVTIKSSSLPPGARFQIEPKYGNKMVYLEQIAKGVNGLDLQVVYDVVRKEVGAIGKVGDVRKQQLALFLQPNSKVPVDGKPIETFERYRKQKSVDLNENPLVSGRVFYDFVEDHLKYDKSKPGYGNGDSVWACDSKTGNCTDFHSLFISIARAKRIPAKFQIGFPLPAARGTGKIGGYHCWAKFFTAESGWVPVDISEADKDPSKKDYFFGKLSENRIQFTTGRDIVLAPKQDGPPLNYFVYPHVEVNGVPYPKDKIKLSFLYADE